MTDTMIMSSETLPAQPYALQVGEFLLQFEEEGPDEYFLEIAERELRETDSSKITGIEALRELVKADPDLHFPVDDDNRLLVFLRPCKFYPQSAYELMHRYYQYRLKNPKVYSNLQPSYVKNIFEQNILSVLPRRDQLGRRVLTIEAGAKWVPSKCKLDEIFQGCALLLEAAMAEPNTQIAGAVVVIDQAGLSLNHVMQFTPGFARAVVQWVQECLPVRLKAIHIINQPYIFNMVFAIFKPFLQEKIRKRIHFHGTDRKSLLKHISAEALPTRYGGKLDIPEVSGQQWHDVLMLRNDDYALLNTFGYKSTTKA